MNILWQWIRRYLAPRTPFKLAALIFLLVMVTVGAAPGYLQGNWRWTWVSPITNLQELREVRQTGIEVPNWITSDRGERLVGSKKWAAQQIYPASDDNNTESDGDRAAQSNALQVMLLPLLSDKDQPQVEWSDWAGMVGITTDSERFVDLQASTGGQRATFTVRLLRGWMEDNTTLVMAQWYAWPGGGSPRPSDWFWADRGSQIRRHRLPWIAVNMVMETERPLDELADYQDLLIDAAIDVQTGLIQGPLRLDKAQTP